MSTPISKKYKACLFDTESKYTKVSNEILEEFNTGKTLSWDVKVKLQGRPGPEASKIFIDEYNLPISVEELIKLSIAKQEREWPQSKFLDGALELLQYLHSKGIPIALGTSSNKLNFERKTSHLQHGFQLFDGHIVTGDDKRIPPGRGKPHPDIWKACLESLNENNDEKILPEECIVFEDGVPGVQAAKAFNAYVVWVPDENALKVLEGKEDEILGENGIRLKSLTELNIDDLLYSS